MKETRVEGGFERSSTGHFTLFQSIYWMTYCFCYLYMVPLLQALGYGEYQVGVLMMVNTGGLCLFQLVWGVLCNNRWNIKAVFMVLATISIPALIGLTHMHTFPLSALFMLLVSATLYAPSTMIDAWCVKLINQGDTINYGASRGTGSAAYAAVALGFGFLIDKQGLSIIPYFYTLSAIALVLVVLFTKVPKKQADVTSKQGNHAVKALARNRQYIVFLATAMVTFTTFGASNTFYPVVLQSLQVSSSYVGVGFSVMAFSEAAMMMFLYKKLHRFKMEQLLVFSIVMIALKTVMFALAPNAVLLVLAQVLQAVGTGIFFPTAVRYISSIVEDKYTITAQTAYGAFSVGLGAMAGNYFGGVLADWMGARTMLFISGLFALTAVLIFIAGMRRPVAQR